MATSATKLKKSSAEQADESLFSSPQKRNVVACLLLVTATLLLYNAVNRNPFINCDDDRYITENPYIHSGLNWATVKWALTSSGQAGFWHPLTWLSHALDISLFGFNPAGHHFVSLLFHCFNAVLVFLLLARVTKRFWPSFIVAAVFAVHPLNVESVAWAAERKNVLSGFFFLATIGAYGWYAPKADWKRYSAVVGLFACALASKPMAVTLPFALLLLDYWPLNRIGKRDSSVETNSEQPSATWLVAEKLPLLAMSAAASVITVIAQKAAGATRSGPDFSFAIRLENAIVSYATYVWKLSYPTHLAPVYPHPGDTLAAWQIGISSVFLLAVTATVLVSRRSYLIIGWFWFLGNLFPTIGLIQVGDQAMADRFAYIPQLGFLVMIVWGGAEIMDSLKAGIIWRAVPAGVTLVALSLVTYHQIGYWHSNYDLWTHALSVTRNNFVAEDNMGGALILLGNEDEAHLHFAAASSINPKDPMSRVNLAAYDQTHNRLTDAVAEYKTVIQLTSEPHMQAQAYANLGAAEHRLGASDQARSDFEKSLRLNPDQFNAWLGKGLIADEQGRPAEAIAYLTRSVELRPTAEGYFYLGQSLAHAGRSPEARIAYQQALQISPEFAEAQKAFAALPSGNR